MSISKRITLTKAEMVSEFGVRLVQHLQGISQDGQFSLEEIRNLDGILGTGPSEMRSVSFLRRLTRPAILDQHIDDHEAYELRLAIQRVLPKALREQVSTQLSAICRPVEEIDDYEYEDFEPATERQLDYIRILGGTPPENLSKWQASDLIDELRQNALPSNRQMMVLRFWDRLDLVEKGRSAVSDWMDQFYAEDVNRLVAWELFKQQVGDDGSQSNPSSVPLGAGPHYLSRVTSAGADAGEEQRPFTSGAPSDFISGDSPDESFDGDEMSRTIAQGFSVYGGLAHTAEATQALIGALRDATTREDRLHSITEARIRFGEELPSSVVEELTSAFLFLVEYLLLDHKLTRTEQSALREVRELLGLDEECLGTALAKQKIRSLIELQIDRIQDDHQIDLKEEDFLVCFQSVFGLGYDQMRELWTPHVTELLNELHLQLSIADRSDIREQIEQLKSTFCMLGYQPPAVAGQDIDQVALRTISQSVKDLVWRRDGGRCVKCGSNQLLQFDHIIPFSLGGSGTCRNIQLLCPPCNRSKSATLH